MKKSKSRKQYLLIALLLLVGITLSYVANTYAKYVGEISRTGTAQVAVWKFEEDNTSSTIEINLTETYDESTLVADRIAPGTEGSFSVNVVNTSSETGVNFEVSIGTIENAPANIKFYSDKAMTQELTLGSGKITGTLVAKDSTGLDVTIYWKWAYEQDDVTTGDEADTTAGELGSELSIPVVISGTQAQPSISAITSIIN